MNETLRHQISDGLKRLELLLDRIPDAMARNMRRQIGDLRELVVDKRAPRFVLVGRRGSGKSSLINAIFGRPVAQVGHEKAQTGKARWWPYTGELGTIEILDTRGIQEGSRPAERDPASSPVQSIIDTLREKSPDALLFLIKATEADAAVDADLAALQTISTEVERLHGYRPPIVVVPTHCDVVEPKNVRLHDPEDEDRDDLAEKTRRIVAIESLLDEKVRSYSDLKDQLVSVIGVSSYQSWKRDGDRRSDERWRIEDLVAFLSDELPNEAKLEFARLTQIRKLQDSIARSITQTVAGIAAGIAAVPIPIADIVPITSLQTTMIMSIAYLSGRRMDLATAREFLVSVGANIGAGFALREVARGMIKFVFPGGGSLVSAGVAYGATIGIGRAATAYYVHGVSWREARAMFESARKAEMPRDQSR